MDCGILGRPLERNVILPRSEPRFQQLLAIAALVLLVFMTDEDGKCSRVLWAAIDTDEATLTEFVSQYEAFPILEHTAEEVMVFLARVFVATFW